MHPGIEMYVCTMFDVLPVQVHITCISSFLYDVEGSVSQTSYRRHLHVVCSGIDCWYILYDSSSSYMYTYVEGWIHNDTRTNKKPILFPYSENSRNVSLYFHCTVATLAGWQPNVTHWYPSVYYWASVHRTTQHHRHHHAVSSSEHSSILIYTHEPLHNEEQQDEVVTLPDHVPSPTFSFWCRRKVLLDSGSL